MHALYHKLFNGSWHSPDIHLVKAVTNYEEGGWGKLHSFNELFAFLNECALWDSKSGRTIQGGERAF